MFCVSGFLCVCVAQGDFDEEGREGMRRGRGSGIEVLFAREGGARGTGHLRHDTLLLSRLWRSDDE